MPRNILIHAKINNAWIYNFIFVCANNSKYPNPEQIWMFSNSLLHAFCNIRTQNYIHAHKTIYMHTKPYTCTPKGNINFKSMHDWELNQVGYKPSFV